MYCKGLAAGLAIEACEGEVFEWPTRLGDTVRAYQPNAASARWTLVLPATRN
jgi:hypothetical protein